MPRQDYSLPDVVSLPKLAAQTTLTRPPPPQSQALPQPQPQPQQEDLTLGKAKQAPESDDDDYDMLEDDGDVLTLLAPLQEQVKGLNITSEPPAASSSSAGDATPTAANSSPTSPFVEMLLNEPNMTTTANMAPTFATTGDARLDFFFEVLHGAEPCTIQSLLRVSWASHPLDTLRLIFQLRSILHGKGERKEFYVCLDFLKKEHPRTLLYNLRFIPDHGYWKDLLNWLVFGVREDTTDYSLSSRPAMPRSKPAKRCTSTSRTACKKAKHETPAQELEANQSSATSKGRVKTAEERQRAIDEAQEKNQELSAAAREARLARDQERLMRARAMFKDDEFYRLLHLEIARLFANALVFDKARLAEGRSISLAAKWCPSLNQFHDSHTLIATSIAQILFPEKQPGEDHVAYVNRVRQQLRQQYYVPLRKATPVLETMMAARRWNEIVYNRVPSIAMKNNKGLFEAKDNDRFTQYLESIAKGETTIASQALMPHQLVSEASALQCQGVNENDLGVRTMEAQWKSYVERLAKTGTMESAMAMCDVSGSMSGQPMEVAIALSLLLTQLTRPPFNRLVLTFSENPQVHLVREQSLMRQVAEMRRMDWGGNTDLAKAFEHILRLSVQNKVAKEDMVKTLFIFSDMEFDQAVQGASHGEAFTNYAVIKRRFEEAGYELPRIVFWNLTGSNNGNKPVRATQEGVAMVSGFSGMLMKLFLDGTDMAQALDPVRLMEKSIHSKEFSRLKVLD